MDNMPELKTLVIDEGFKRQLALELPQMNEPQILDMWFKFLPDARRDQPGQEADDRLYVCGMLVTQMRTRALAQHSIERLHRCQVLSADMSQVANHLKYKAVQADPRTRAASKGLWTPGMGDE